MPEARRATLLLAGLIAFAVAAVALLASYPASLLSTGLEPLAPFCYLLAALPVLGGVAVALVRLARTLWGTNRVMARLTSMPSGAFSSTSGRRVAARAARLGLPVSPMVADLGGRPAAFTVGLLRPRIVVSTATVEALADGELEAILLHEAAHARRRDPLRLLVAGVCRDLLFFLPIGHTLFESVRGAQERAADDLAAERTGPLEVAGALLALLRIAGRRRQAELLPAATGAGAEARVRRLLGLPEAGDDRRAWSRMGAGAVASILLLAVLAGLPARVAGLAPAGPPLVHPPGLAAIHRHPVHLDGHPAHGHSAHDRLRAARTPAGVVTERSERRRERTE